jgi:microcystin-dependent protein
MAFSTKAWQNAPSTSTPLSAAGMIDLESRLAGYADTLIPIGIILPWGGLAAPNAQFLLCQGQLISTTTYATLYGIFGTRFGSGSGTFGIPDLRGRVPVGVGGSFSSGAVGGEITHLLTWDESGTNGNGSTGGESGHTHTTYSYGRSDVNSGTTGNWVAVTGWGGSQAFGSGGSSGHMHGLNSRNADTAHNNMPPYQVINYICRVL